MYVCYSQLQSPITKTHLSSKIIDTFRISIQNFIAVISQEPYEEYSINDMTNQFSFQRRRFYDVLNVLESVGLCRKHNFETVIWLGKENCKKKINHLAKTSGVFDEDKNLNEVMPPEPCISIVRLTELFVLSFLSLRQQIIDIRKIGLFLSRENKRYKSTLCKLYQISHILESAGLIEKTTFSGEVKLSDDYFINKNDYSTGFKDSIQNSPLMLSNLLNRPIEKEKSVYEKRRGQFNLIQSSLSNSKYRRD